MAQSQRQRVVSYLAAHGYLPVQRTYAHYMPYAKGDKTYFLGRNGAIRVSNDGKVTNSVSITDVFMKRVEQWEKSQ